MNSDQIAHQMRIDQDLTSNCSFFNLFVSMEYSVVTWTHLYVMYAYTVVVCLYYGLAVV